MERLARAALMLLAAVMVGCEDTKEKAFSVSPAELEFSAELDAEAPAAQSIVITPNSRSSVFPQITAEGDAIATEDPSPCVELSTSNLVCNWGGADSTAVFVTVPVPDPDDLGAGVHTGSIVIASSEHSVTIPVTYTVSAGPATVTQVTPHPVVAGVEGTVTVRGHGFAHFGSATPTVTFGATDASNIVVVNNTTLSVSHPPLDAGTYDVSVSGASVPFTSTAQLVVTAPRDLPQTSVASTGQKFGLIFDATRQSIYVAKTDVIEKYDGADWSASPVTGSVTGVGAIALSADGRHLIAAGKNKFHDLDPDTLVEAGATDATDTTLGMVDCWYAPCFDTATMTSNGEVVAVSSSQWQEMYFYDVAAQTVSSSTDFLPYPDGNLYTPTVSGSAEGNRILVTHLDSPALYDATQRTLAAIDAEVGAPRSLSADGTVIVGGTAVLKDSGEGYVTHATLPELPDGLLVSPDGNTVYAYFIASNVIRPYDVSVADTVTAGTDIPLGGTPAANILMTISPDGRTVFVAGDNSIEIIPVP